MQGPNDILTEDELLDYIKQKLPPQLAKIPRRDASYEEMKTSLQNEVEQLQLKLATAEEKAKILEGRYAPGLANVEPGESAGDIYGRYLRPHGASVNKTRAIFMNRENAAIYWSREMWYAAGRIYSFAVKYCTNDTSRNMAGQLYAHTKHARVVEILDELAPRWENLINSKSRRCFCLMAVLSCLCFRSFIEPKAPITHSNRTEDKFIPIAEINDHNKDWISYFYFWLGGTEEDRRNWLALTQKIATSRPDIEGRTDIAIEACVESIDNELGPFIRGSKKEDSNKDLRVIITQFVTMGYEMSQQPHTFFFSWSTGKPFDDNSMKNVDPPEKPTKEEQYVHICIFPGVRIPPIQITLNEMDADGNPIFHFDPNKCPEKELVIVVKEQVSCHNALGHLIFKRSGGILDTSPGFIYFGRPGLDLISEQRKHKDWEDYVKRRDDWKARLRAKRKQSKKKSN